MQIEQKLCYSSIDVGDRVRLTALELPSGPPLPFRSGNWQVGWTNIGVVQGEDRLALVWTNVEPQVSFLEVQLTFVDSKGKVLVDISTSSSFPPTRDGRLESDLMRTPTKVTARLEVTEILPPTPDPNALNLLAAFAAYSAGPSAFNVRLAFPRQFREIWSSESVLRQSPYFSTLLSSGFAETSGGNLLSDSRQLDLSSFDDSDDETDSTLPKPPPTLSLPTSPTHKTITVTETAYSTYLAVVCWLQCRHIVFGSLTSSYRSTGSSSRKAATKRRFADAFPESFDDGQPPSSSPPAPVSPKSVYRLSHLLELPALSSLALSSFSSQLTTANAAYELFSSTSACYDELCTAALDFVLKHVEEVFESEAMKEMERKAEADELTSQEGMIWARLARRLVKERK
ncbi:hypothetical protein JCM8097_000710 [Rhodosporidiobolus ruineniae]